jgi:hypothetical protein
MLENWNYTCNTTTGEGRGTWSYQGYLGTGVLKDGSFGVSDKSLRRPAGQAVREVPRRHRPGHGQNRSGDPDYRPAGPKSNVVVRNLVVEHFANKTDRSDGETPFILQKQAFFNWREEHAIGTPSSKTCEFRWNNGTGYNLTGNINVTLRRISAHHNGGNGCSSGLHGLQRVGRPGSFQQQLAGVRLRRQGQLVRGRPQAGLVRQVHDHPGLQGLRQRRRRRVDRRQQLLHGLFQH